MANQQKVKPNVKRSEAQVDVFGKLSFWKLTISSSIFKQN